jgi:6-pyruvoyltetrahydropterin/6-carboxytetrahydropterin synthase
MYQAIKRIEHSEGLSVCFRQWSASSHCRFLHGYALAFEFTFEGATLDSRNWVIDFGGFGLVKSRLRDLLDHRLYVAADDPHLSAIGELDGRLAQVMVVPRLSMELFAELAASVALAYGPSRKGASLAKVQAWEHPGNSAAWLNRGQAPPVVNAVPWQEYRRNHVPSH